MNPRLWKTFASLGVPGVALGVLYALYKGLGFTFPTVPPQWVGPIVVLFLLIVGGVTFYALHRHAPEPAKRIQDSDAASIASAGDSAKEPSIVLEAKGSEHYTFQNSVVFSDERLNDSVVKELSRAKLTLTLDLPSNVSRMARFLYILVRFGRKENLADPSNSSFHTHGQLVNKILEAVTQEPGPRGEYTVVYEIPVHKALGVTFKPCVDLATAEGANLFMESLCRSGMRDVKISDSSETRRVYFILPLSHRNVVASAEGILDNFLYPM